MQEQVIFEDISIRCSKNYLQLYLMSEVVDENLFRVLEFGDRNILTAKEEAIIIVGLTRAGKSTSFNWILKRPLIGQGSSINPYYANCSEDELVAKLGNLFTSVTLAPNIYANFRENASLIDMAGFQDSRNFVGVIGVSYFLKAVFERVKKVKFLIVFDQQRFTEPTGEGLAKTFNGFINMFEFGLMSPEVKEKFKKSIGILVTRASHGPQHYEFLAETSKMFKDDKLKIENKELIVELIEGVWNQNRNGYFKAAVKSQNPEECNIIQRFDQNTDWSFFDLAATEKSIGKSLIKVPFTKDFDSLKAEERTKFQTAIEEKVTAYTKFPEILRVLRENFKSNWEQFVSEWKKNKKVIKGISTMQQMFKSVKEFLKENDDYNTESRIEVQFKIQYKQLSLVGCVRKILQIYDIMDTMIERSQEKVLQFKEVMEIYRQEVKALIGVLEAFVTNAEEEKTIKRLEHVMQRGFREFSILYELDKESIHHVKQRLFDQLNEVVFSEHKVNLLFVVIQGLNSEILARVFPSIESLKDYERFLKIFEQLQSESRDHLNKQGKQLKIGPSFFRQIQCNIESTKADLLLRQGLKEAALHCYIRALKNYGVILQEINKGLYPEDVRELNLSRYHMRMVSLVRKIVGILINLPEDNEAFQPKIAALKLCLHYTMIDDCIEIYALVIKSLASSQEKLQKYDEFAEFCLKWGLIEKSVELLNKKIRYMEEDFCEQQDCANKIKEIIKDREDYLSKAAARYGDRKRAPFDGDLLDLLNELAAVISE